MPNQAVSTKLWILLLLVSLPACVWAEGKPYEAVNRSDLSSTLQEWRMGSLLERLASVTGDTNLQMVLRQRLIANPSTPEETRLKLAAEVADLLEKQITALEEKLDNVDDDMAEIKLLRAVNRARCQRIEYLGMQMGQMYIDKILNLMETPADRTALSKLEVQAVAALLKQERVLDREIRRCRRDTTLTALLLQNMQDMQSWLNYSGSFIRLYRAMTMPKGPQFSQDGNDSDRANILYEGLKQIKPYATQKEFRRVPWARLCRGRLFREAGRFGEAETDFAWAAQQNQEAGIKIEGAFEKARNLIEWGTFLIAQGKVSEGESRLNQAKTAIAEFRTLVVKTQGAKMAFAADAKSLCLNLYLFDNWKQALAKAKQPAAKIAKVDLGFQKAIADIFAKYRAKENLQQALVALLESKLKGVEMDPKTSPAVIVSLMAMSNRNKGQIEYNKSGQKVTPKAEKFFAQAVKLYAGIQARTDKASEEYKPDCYWGLGLIHYFRGDRLDSIQAFRTLANDYPKHANAGNAALNSIQMINQLIEIGPDTPEMRIELEKTIIVMLKIVGNTPDAMGYYSTLGENYIKLSEMVSEQKVAYIDKAIAAYGKVPETDVLYTYAHYNMLDLEYEKLQAAKTKAPDAARDLMSKMLRYGTVCHDWVKRGGGDPKKEEPTAAELSEWGSQVEFHAWILRYDFLDGKQTAMEKIEGLGKRWPGTAILRQSETYFIRKLLAQGKVTDAFKRVDKFVKDYGDKAAEGLMTQVSAALRKQISDLEFKGDKEKLIAYRKAYLSLGEKIYSTLTPADSQAKRVAYTGIRVDSLITSEDPANLQIAFGLLQELKGIEDAKNAVYLKEIAMAIDVKIATAKKATTVDLAKALPPELDATVKGYGLGEYYPPSRTLAVYWVEELDMLLKTQAGPKEERPTAGEINTAVAKISEMVVKGYGELKARLDRTVSINANMLRMRARCFYLLKKYDEALPLYRQLILGLKHSSALYWKSEYEYGKCYLDVNKADAEKIKLWLVRLEQLRQEDRTLHKLVGQFNMLEIKAKALIAAPPAPAE